MPFKTKEENHIMKKCFALLAAAALLALCIVPAMASTPVTCPDGHTDVKLIKTYVAAGCEKEGIGEYTCNTCGTTFISFINMLGHNYGEWTPAGEGKHQATCQRCGLVYTTDCSASHLTVAGEDHAICSVCGQDGKTVFGLTGGEIRAAANGALPSGKIIIRGMADPFGGNALEEGTVVYAFTATKQFFGKSRVLNAYDVPASITVPVENADGATLYRVDGGALTALDFTAQNGNITFVSNQFGLFLLVK